MQTHLLREGAALLLRQQERRERARREKEREVEIYRERKGVNIWIDQGSSNVRTR